MTGYLSGIFGSTYSFGMSPSDDKTVSFLFEVTLRKVTIINDEDYR